MPALVQTATDVGSLERALVENLHREDLNPIEEAAAYQQLIEDFSLTHEQSIPGRQEPGGHHQHVATVPAAAQRPALSHRRPASAGHAVPSWARRTGPSRRPWPTGSRRRPVRTRGRGTVRARNELAPRVPNAGSTPTRSPPTRDRRTQKLLSQHLDTRVKVDMGPRKGRMAIEFATLEDLERIYRAMTEADPDAEKPEG